MVVLFYRIVSLWVLVSRTWLLVFMLFLSALVSRTFVVVVVAVVAVVVVVHEK